MQISFPKTVDLNPEVLFQELDTQTILLNISNEQYFGLDEIGSRLWQLFSKNNNADDVLAQMLVEFDVDQVRLSNDLTLFIQELSEAGLIFTK